MHNRKIPKTVVEINDKRRRVLALFNKSYQAVLDSFKAESNATISDHNVKSDEEIKKESPSFIVRATINAIDLVIGTDLTLKTVELPDKKEYFEPAAKIVFDEFRDYLDRVLIKDRMDRVYQSGREKKIRHTSILLKDLLLRFASEILQYHNEHERDGDKLINGFSMFIDDLKNDPIFMGKQGVYKKVVKELFNTIDYWLILFKECVALVKALNLNNQAITTGIEAITKLRESLMSILIGKYLKLLSLDQGFLTRLGSAIIPAWRTDLKDTQAIVSDNITRTLIDYEEIAWNILSEKDCNKEYIKALTTIDHQPHNEMTISDSLSISLNTNESHLIEMMHNYIQKHSKDNNNGDYESLSLDEVYALIIKTNQYMLAMEKLASMTKAGGWHVYISGIVTLDDFLKSIKDHSSFCISFISEFKKDKMFSDKRFEVLQSAIISRDSLNAFKLTCQFTDAISQLETIVSPKFLNLICNYFAMEMASYIKIGTILNCKMVNQDKLEKFGKWMLEGTQEEHLSSSIGVRNTINNYEYRNNSMPLLEAKKPMMSVLEVNTGKSFSEPLIIPRRSESSNKINLLKSEEKSHSTVVNKTFIHGKTEIANISASYDQHDSGSSFDDSNFIIHDEKSLKGIARHDITRFQQSDSSSHEKSQTKSVTHKSKKSLQLIKRSSEIIIPKSLKKDHSHSSSSNSNISRYSKAEIAGMSASGDHQYSYGEHDEIEMQIIPQNSSSSEVSRNEIKKNSLKEKMPFGFFGKKHSSKSATSHSHREELGESSCTRSEDTSDEKSGRNISIDKNRSLPLLPEKEILPIQSSYLKAEEVSVITQNKPGLGTHSYEWIFNLNKVMRKNIYGFLFEKNDGSLAGMKIMENLCREIKAQLHPHQFSTLMELKGQMVSVDKLRDDNNRTLLYRELELQGNGILASYLFDKGADPLSLNGKCSVVIAGKPIKDCTYVLENNLEDEWEASCTSFPEKNPGNQWVVKYYKHPDSWAKVINIDSIPGLSKSLGKAWEQGVISTESAAMIEKHYRKYYMQTPLSLAAKTMGKVISNDCKYTLFGEMLSLAHGKVVKAMDKMIQKLEGENTGFVMLDFTEKYVKPIRDHLGGYLDILLGRKEDWWYELQIFFSSPPQAKDLARIYQALNDAITTWNFVMMLGRLCDLEIKMIDTKYPFQDELRTILMKANMWMHANADSFVEECYKYRNSANDKEISEYKNTLEEKTKKIEELEDRIKALESEKNIQLGQTKSTTESTSTISIASISRHHHHHPFHKTRSSGMLHKNDIKASERNVIPK